MQRFSGYQEGNISWSFKWKQSKSKENLSLISSEQDKKVKSAGKKEKTSTGNKKKTILKNSRKILENNEAFLRSKKALLGNKRTLLENKRATTGNKRAFLENKSVILENKRAILQIKGHFWEVKGLDLRTRAFATSPLHRPSPVAIFGCFKQKEFKNFPKAPLFLQVRYPNP